MSLVTDILNQLEAAVESVTLLPSEGGRFEVTVNGILIYSKLATRRHAEPGEVMGLIKKSYQS